MCLHLAHDTPWYDRTRRVQPWPLTTPTAFDGDPMRDRDRMNRVTIGGNRPGHFLLVDQQDIDGSPRTTPGTGLTFRVTWPVIGVCFCFRWVPSVSGDVPGRATTANARHLVVVLGCQLSCKYQYSNYFYWPVSTSSFLRVVSVAIIIFTELIRLICFDLVNMHQRYSYNIHIPYPCVTGDEGTFIFTNWPR